MLRRSPVQRKRTMLSACLACCFAATSFAQQPNWTPEPFVAPSNLRPISSAPRPLQSSASSATPLRDASPSAKSSQADANAGLTPKPALVARWRKPNPNANASTAAYSSNATSFANNSESLVTRGGFHEPSRSVVQAQFQAPQAPGVGSDAPFQPPKLDAIPSSPQTPAPNQLRLGQGEGDAPALRTPPVQNQDASPLPLNQFAPPAANQNAELESNRSGTIQLQEPGNGKQEDDKAPAPPSPFPRQPNVDVDSGQSKGDDSPFKKGEDKGAESKRDGSLVSMDCEKLRERAMTADISKIKLDVSPSFATDIGEEEKSENKKAQFARTSPMRQWNDFRGQFIVDGRMVDLRQGQAVIETASGSSVRYNLSDLSDADQLYVLKRGGFRNPVRLGSWLRLHAASWSLRSSTVHQGCATNRSTLKMYSWNVTAMKSDRSFSPFFPPLTSSQTSRYCHTRQGFIHPMNASMHWDIIAQEIVLLGPWDPFPSACEEG